MERGQGENNIRGMIEEDPFVGGNTRVSLQLE